MFNLSQNTQYLLKNSKNLLAFSGGVDSSALFYFLIESKIEFNFAIVNYNLREEAISELQFAESLAKKYNKKLYVKSIQDLNINTPNLEMKARNIRYSFFQEIIKKNNYNNLITAHQLNDKLEWFLMQFSKGAGILELMGFDEVSENYQEKNFNLIRPLINYTKDNLLDYLNQNNFKYFIDKSNFDQKFKRNFIRHNFSDELLRNYKNGITNSFNYLNIDKNILIDNYLKNSEIRLIFDDIFYFRNTKNSRLNIYLIDKIFKKFGILLSKESRNEILRQKEIIINNISVFFNEENSYIFVFKFYNLERKMPKEFKEECRKLKIAKNLRKTLFFKNKTCKDLVLV
jgi:tRNA(Ile)-lysidine synthase